MLDLRTVLVGVFVERTIVTRTSRLECAGRDVVLQELAVDDVDYGGDEGFDVFGTADQGFNIIYLASGYRRIPMGQG